MNKQINLKLFLCILCVLCLTFSAISCSKKGNKNSEPTSSSDKTQSESVIESESIIESESATESESEESVESEESESTPSYVSVSGIIGTGYRIEGLATKVERGETVEFTVVISKDYLLSSPTVKVNGTEVAPNNGKYSVTASENLQITVENLVKYEIVDNSPISLNGTVSTSIISHPASSLTNVIPTNYQQASLKNVGLGEYLSIVFFVKAEGLDKWILIKNKDGQDLYSNAIRNHDDSGWIADDVWHKVEIKKEEAVYQLYVDGVKVEKYDNVDVNATATRTLSEFSFLFNENANYYFSELFGAKNPDYVEPDEFTVSVDAGGKAVEGELTAKKGTDVTFSVTADEGYTLTATNAEIVSIDGLVYTFKVPSIYSNVTVTITQEVDLEDVLTTELWTKKGYDGRFINTANGYTTSRVYIGSKSTYTGAPLSYVYLNPKYEEIRFSIYSVDSQWFELGIVDEESWNLAAANKAVWTEFSLRKEGDIFQLYVNGTRANGSLAVGRNLNEWQLKLASSGTFYTSEVIGKIDVNYVPPKSHTVTVISNGLTVSGELTVEEGTDAIFTVSAPEGYSLSADNAELVSTKGLIYTFKVAELLEDVTVTIISTKLTDTVISQSPWTKEPAVGDEIYTDGGYTVSNLYLGSNANYKGAPLVDFILTGDYKEVRFAIYSVDGSWFEIGSTKENTWDLLVGNKKGWTEVKLVNEGKGVFQLYEDGILSDGSVAVGGNLNELQMKIGTSGTFYITELLAKRDPNYVPPKEYTVTVNADGLDVDGKLTAQEGADVTFTVTANEGYILFADNAKLLSINGLVYTYKVDDLAEDVTVNVTSAENPYTALNSTPWTKEPGVGNLFNLDGYYVVSNQYLGNNTNYYGAPLADLVLLNYYEEIRFAIYSASGKWYEIGSTAENTWDVLVGNETAWTEIVLINDGNGLFKLYKNDKWTNESIAVGGNLNELQMRIASSGTFYITELLAKLNPELAPKLHTVTVLADGLLVEGTLTAEEGTDVTFSVTANEGYTLSADNAELLSVDGLVYTFTVKNISSNVTVTVTASEIKPTTIVVAQNPWVKAGVESDFICTEKGYSYSTAFTGSNSTYAGDYLTNLVLTNNYKEIRFAIYSADGYWWEIGFVSSSEWNVAVSNQKSWIEVRLVNDGKGNFKVYRNDEDRNASIAVGSNLNSLRMRLGTSGTFYISEVLGVVENVAEESVYEKIAQNPFGLSGEEITGDLGSEHSLVTTVATTKWTASGYKFAEVDVSKYSEICFFVKSSTWFEMYSPDKATKFYASKPETWTEIKLVKGESSWTVYANGLEKGQIVLTNLKDDFFVQLGDATVYISELLGLPIEANA